MSHRFEVDREPAPEHGTVKAPAQLDTGVTPRRKTRTRRALMVGLLIMILLVPGSVGAYFFSMANIYDSETVKIEDAFPAEASRVPATETPAGVSAPLNILVMGSDSRDKTEGSASAKAAAGSASNQRADTLMLLHIPADRAHIYSVSLMRDLWTDIPDHGQAKINSALAFGGVPLMVQTVESLLQQRIDHVVSLDFAGFKGLTDALGGVEVDVKVPFTSVRGGKTYVFNKGVNTLNGAEALVFVRERYAFPDGDYQRVRNQQAYLRAIIAKTFDGGTLGNPITLAKVLSAVSPYLSVAPKLDSVELGSLAFSLRDIRSRDTVFFTLPTAGVGTSKDGQSIVLPDTGAIGELKAALSADKLGDFVAARNLSKGN